MMQNLAKTKIANNPAVVTISATVIAALLGLGTGAIVAHFSPSNKISWLGLALAPLGLLLEIFIELVAGVLGLYSRGARIAVPTVLLLGFYIAWFALKHS